MSSRSKKCLFFQCFSGKIQKPNNGVALTNGYYSTYNWTLSMPHISSMPAWERGHPARIVKIKAGEARVQMPCKGIACQPRATPWVTMSASAYLPHISPRTWERRRRPGSAGVPACGMQRRAKRLLYRAMRKARHDAYRALSKYAACMVYAAFRRRGRLRSHVSPG